MTINNNYIVLTLYNNLTICEKYNSTYNYIVTTKVYVFDMSKKDFEIETKKLGRMTRINRNKLSKQDRFLLQIAKPQFIGSEKLKRNNK